MFDYILKTNDFESILINKAKGSWFWDVDGKKYLDCESGMWCCNLGHNHPKIVEAIKNQLSEISHRNGRFLTPITLEAAEEVLKFFPHKYDKITFLSSGTEAVEFAINIAKKITNRDKLLSLSDSYLGAYWQAEASSYTSKESKLKIPYCKNQLGNCDCLDKYSFVIDEIFQNESSAPACFILEPIMVSCGIYKPCSNFIRYLNEKIHEVNGLLIVDEVTTGFGRAGFKFGYQHFKLNPDVIAIGKALGNGYPISAVITNSSLESKCNHTDLHYVQSHQLDPLGAAFAKAVVNVYDEEKIIEKISSKINDLKKFFESLSDPYIKEARSFGMIFALQLQQIKNLSSENLVIKLKDLLMKEGIMVGISLRKELLRFLPPLNISQSEIEFLKEKLTYVFKSKI